MRPSIRVLLPVAAIAILIAGNARAERILAVNEIATGSGVFDQPSVTANGTTLHVAFVGDNTSGTPQTPTTVLYYAAVNGAADFTSAATTRSQVIVTPATAIDNRPDPVPYTQARHPQIVLRSANQAVVFFQAIPQDDPGAGYKLFRALLTLDNNAVTTQRVSEVRDPLGARMAGTLVDPSFGIVATDNTARIVYVDSTPEADGTVHVHYARVGLDNALLAGSPLRLTEIAASRGVRPLPRLRLDALSRSHVAWAANNRSGASSGVYYALVKGSSTPGVDNVAIASTQVLAGGHRWGFPIVLVEATNRILVVAADEPNGPDDASGIAGSLGISLLNPDGVTQNGLPVSFANAGTDTAFFLFPPGQTVLGSNFNAYRPEAAFDGTFHVYVAGYGTIAGESPLRGTPGRFYSMAVSGATTGTGTISGFAEMSSSPLPVGDGDLAFAGSIPGDYTRPAFARFNGKSVLFWSGPELAGGRNLYVTSAASFADPPTTATQSGCQAVDDPRRGEPERVPGAVALLLPAALLLLRRAARKVFDR